MDVEYINIQNVGASLIQLAEMQTEGYYHIILNDGAYPNTNGQLLLLAHMFT